MSPYEPNFNRVLQVRLVVIREGYLPEILVQRVKFAVWRLGQLASTTMSPEEKYNNKILRTNPQHYFRYFAYR
jgi:hypothetical protein